MDLFKAEKVGEIESNSDKCCPACGEPLRLVRVVFFPDKDALVRAFECECGTRIWDE